MSARIDRLESSTYVIPTDAPESDGTFAWTHTTLVIVRVHSGQAEGIGYTYADRATAVLARDVLGPVVKGLDATAIPTAWNAMVGAIRNLGRPGVASMAISAVDAALWDLKGHLLGQPVVRLLGAARQEVPVYGSGGFTSYSEATLRAQLTGWAEAGCRFVKMKVGRHPEDDCSRVRAARAAIGPDVELFVDANGAYTRKQALRMADAFAELDVRWFEEPVSSDDLEGLRLLRDRAPASMNIAAGEYGYDLPYFRRMLEAGAVDVLQADASRCGGISAFSKVAALTASRSLPLSGHCAPQLHLHPACALADVEHLEYFHDHARIEQMFFDGVATVTHGVLRPDLSRPGLGIALKRGDVERYAVR